MMKSYRNILLFFFLWSFTPCLAQDGKNDVVNVARFGAKPDDGKDDTKALRKAAEYCREHKGSTLFFPAGVYQLKDSEALKLEEDVLSGKFGENPEKVIFTPYYPYVKGLDLSGASDVTLQGEGAIFLCEGWMEPISIVDCNNVKVCGITIDYKRKPFSTGDVVVVADGCFEVLFSDERIITDRIPLMRMTFWDKITNTMYPEPIYFPKRELLGSNRVRFYHSIPQKLLGSKVGAGHSFHFRPGILIYRSTNTLLENITIHSQPGMGIVGFDSKDILLKRLSVIPAPGYCFSTNTDATHFACCEGVLHFTGCRFIAQGDDATNVHGYYQTILSVEKRKARLRIDAPTYTHAQVPDVPRVGDEMELVDIRTLCPIRVYKVSAVEWQVGSIEPVVTFAEELPDDFSNYYLFNITKLPQLIFENNLVDSHHARGVLIKTRNVTVRNNVFRRGTGTAIHVGAEGGWHEGTHSMNVLIEDNVISGCGLGAGSQQGACGISVNVYADDTEATYLHDGINIENNLILGDGNPCGIYIGNAKNVLLKNNAIHRCKETVILHSTENVNLEN